MTVLNVLPVLSDRQFVSMMTGATIVSIGGLWLSMRRNLRALKAEVAAIKAKLLSEVRRADEAETRADDAEHQADVDRGQ